MDEEDVAVAECTRCEALCGSRSRIVNGVGPVDADLLFVGEAPGAKEDAQGEPFVGRSGEVLTDALRDRGFARADVRITNCVRCRPPDNRDPTVQELENCRPYIDREIAIVDPAVVVTLGKVPSELLLERSVVVTKEAGTLHDVAIEGAPRRVLVCVHPAAILYDRSQLETFERTLDEAIALTGDAGNDQATLDEY